MFAGEARGCVRGRNWLRLRGQASAHRLRRSSRGSRASKRGSPGEVRSDARAGEDGDGPGWVREEARRGVLLLATGWLPLAGLGWSLRAGCCAAELLAATGWESMVARAASSRRRLRNCFVSGRSDAIRESCGCFCLNSALSTCARAGNGVSLVLEEGLDAQGHLDIAAAVEALSGATLVGLELRELTLPKAQDVGGDLAEACHLADAEVELVRDLGRERAGAMRNAADWLVACHWPDPNPPLQLRLKY